MAAINELEWSGVSIYVLLVSSCAKSRRAFAKKFWKWTKISSPNIRCCIAILKIVAIFAFFGRLWVKNSASWDRSALLPTSATLVTSVLRFWDNEGMILLFCTYA